MPALNQKIQRLYAAIGAAEDRDLQKYVGRRDFSGGKTEPAILNAAWAVIRSTSDLRDNLKKWAAVNGRDKNEVEVAIDQCLELAVIMDLANYDKHGDHDRDGGRSKLFPVLKDVKQVLRITAKARSGLRFGFMIQGNALVPVGGDDTVVSVTGTVVLKDGRTLELTYVQQKAVEAWESLFARLGIAPTAG